MNSATSLTAIVVALAASSAQAATCYRFDIVLDATVSGNYGTVENRVQEVAVLRDEGVRNNSFELLIRYPGDLNGADVRPGTIELMTNSAFARNAGMAGARFDLASARRQGDDFRFRLEPSAAFQLPPPNVMAAPGPNQSPGGFGGECLLPGLQGLCEQLRGSAVLGVSYLVPGSGGGSFRLFQDGIEGEIDVTGHQVDNSNNRGRYRATFEGRLVGRQAC